MHLERIAKAIVRTKYFGADLIEEVMYDNELNFVNGREVKPMHLQTVDMRMPFCNVRKWDLMAVKRIFASLIVRLVCGILGRWFGFIGLIFLVLFLVEVPC